MPTSPRKSGGRSRWACAAFFRPQLIRTSSTLAVEPSCRQDPNQFPCLRLPFPVPFPPHPRPHPHPHPHPHTPNFPTRAGPRGQGHERERRRGGQDDGRGLGHAGCATTLGGRQRESAWRRRRGVRLVRRACVPVLHAAVPRHHLFPAAGVLSWFVGMLQWGLDLPNCLLLTHHAYAAADVAAAAFGGCRPGCRARWRCRCLWRTMAWIPARCSRR